MKKLAISVLVVILIVGCLVVFAGCNKNDGLDYANTDESCAIISGVNYKDNELKIPSTHDGKPVNGVLEYAFVRNYSITDVTLPDGVTFIGDGAFYSCNQITTVNLPSTLTNIGYKAFSHCEKLEKINFGGTKAQWYAVEKEYLWDDYSGEYTIVCTDGTLTKALNGNDLGTAGLIYEIYLKSWQCVLENGINAESEDVEVSAKYYNYDVTAIGESAFLGADIKSVKIPEGITFIEDEAFKDCALLSKVYLPSTIGNIGVEAFGECDSLTDIYFNGTRENWNDITKDINWDKDSAQYTVHCSDDAE